MMILRHRYGVAASAALAALVLGTTACNTDKLLKVKDPDVLYPGNLNNAQSLPTVLAGAIADFQATYQGTGDVNESSGQIGYSGLLGDEIRSSDTFPTRNEIDQRLIQLDNASNESQFYFLSRARQAADFAAQQYATYGDSLADHALVLALGGFTRVLFAEDYCSGVPITNMDANSNITYGIPLTTAQMLDSAIARFQAALAVSGISATYRNLASVGLGRALLDEGKYAQAAAAVANVPSSFQYVIESSANTTRENNGVWTFNSNVRRLTLVDKEGGEGLDYLSAHDPRVQYDTLKDGGKVVAGFDGETPLVLAGKYPTRDAGAVLASGVEARLIQAEAAMQANDPQGMLDNLNAARAQFAGVPALTLADIPATDAARVDLLFRERAFDLYLTAHRLGDMRRLARPATADLGGYGRGQDAVFPTGAFFKGDTYGTNVSLPVPQSEQANPEFHGCLDTTH